MSLLSETSLRNGRKEARQILAAAIEQDQGDTTVYLLRRDGDTEIFRAVRSVGGYAQFVGTTSGWITCGHYVSATDMPCLIWGNH